MAKHPKHHNKGEKHPDDTVDFPKSAGVEAAEAAKPENDAAEATRENDQTANDEPGKDRPPLQDEHQEKRRDVPTESSGTNPQQDNKKSQEDGATNIQGLAGSEKHVQAVASACTAAGQGEIADALHDAAKAGVPWEEILSQLIDLGKAAFLEWLRSRKHEVQSARGA